MDHTVEPRHDLSPLEIDGLEDRLYAYNVVATGYDDGQGLGFVAKDPAGEMIGAAAGYTWGGIAEIKQLWVAEAHRGSGLGRRLLDAAVAEAKARGVERVWLASYDFQAPGFYEKAGFVRMAEFDGWPRGHVSVVLCKTFEAAA